MRAIARCWHAITLTLLWSATLTNTAETIVRVGDNGAFYNPVIVAAPLGTVITFQFVGTAHSVVQSSYNAPCAPMANGFDSGIAGLAFGGTLDNPMEWNLTITNDSIPIFYHCKSQLPTPHCQSGMVGGINVGPPSTFNALNQSFDAFSSAAETATTGQPTATISVSLIGQGATATAVPQVRVVSSTTSSTSDATSTATTTVTSSASSSPISSSKHSNVGAIAGGVVGGLVGVGLIGGLILLLVRTRRKTAVLQAEKLSQGGSSWLSTDNSTKSTLRPRPYYPQ